MKFGRALQSRPAQLAHVLWRFVDYNETVAQGPPRGELLLRLLALGPLFGGN